MTTQKSAFFVKCSAGFSRVKGRKKKGAAAGCCGPFHMEYMNDPGVLRFRMPVSS